MQEYVPKEIEAKWQKYWEEHNLLDFDFDSENYQHKEELFKLKLKMFEQDVVKNSKAKTKKTAIRKAETPLEVISAYHTFIK